MVLEIKNSMRKNPNRQRNSLGVKKKKKEICIKPRSYYNYVHTIDQKELAYTFLIKY